MAMDLEVDVKLFITCRLCLDEPGSYQIVPCIKDQIKYCFGIDIDPFDGLPQLICKKCKCILSEYYATKNIFVEKQKNLHSKLPIDTNAQTLIAPKAESVKSVAAADAASHCDSVKSAEAADAASRGNCVKSVDDADIVPRANSVKATTEDVVPKSKSKKRIASWKKEFNRHFVCTICDKSFLTEKSVKRHSPSHKKLMTRHQKIFKSYVTVQLNKIDRKKNVTGGLKNVVYNNDKIICGRGNTKYHSIYLKKGFTPSDDKIDENENVAAKRPMILSDDDIGKGKKRKCRRIFSTSSTETVVLENNKGSTELEDREHQNNPHVIVTDNPEYINVDDTSSDCPRANADLEKKRILPKRQQVKAEVGDYKAIQNIVTMCHKNYIKKIQTNSDALNKSTFSESSLKHKVLSLGRKVINKQGFSSTGLLRYMEHKDLDITWTPTSSELQKKASNFVRILAKLKSREDSENDDAGWKKLHDISFCSDSGMEARVTAPSEAVRSDDQASLPPALADEDPALANGACEPNDLNYRNKLLNKTPVANPKQLPKKNNMPDTKPIIIKADDPTFIPPNIAVSDALENADAEESNMCLPIITSTTSLSAQVNEIEKQEVPVVEKPAPRIKVKPASELMSARALNNQETVEDIWQFNSVQSSLPHHLANAEVALNPPISEVNGGFISSQASSFGLVAYQSDTQSQIGEIIRKDEPPQNLEYITLDSPHFPNNKTKSPFQYFKKVLQVYGLKLLELNEDLPQQFNCLIKFKLMLKQDNKKPIGVLLSLFCAKDTFCFSFKDTNSKKFDPNQLPAFWQWELLKIYKGDVGCKILQNASKVGKEVHKCTELLLSLLKSIKLTES